MCTKTTGQKPFSKVFEMVYRCQVKNVEMQEAQQSTLGPCIIRIHLVYYSTSTGFGENPQGFSLVTCMMFVSSVWILVHYAVKMLISRQNFFGQFITQKFPSLKSKQFSQFFLVRGKSERIDKI